MNEFGFSLIQQMLEPEVRQLLLDAVLPQPRLENPWARVRQTLREAQKYRDLKRFLICLLFYQAGITAVVALAAIYAEQAMKFTMQQTITLILVVNVTAALGAFGFGYLQDAIGHRVTELVEPGHVDRSVLHRPPSSFERLPDAPSLRSTKTCRA